LRSAWVSPSAAGVRRPTPSAQYPRRQRTNQDHDLCIGAIPGFKPDQGVAAAGAGMSVFRGAQSPQPAPLLNCVVWLFADRRRCMAYRLSVGRILKRDWPSFILSATIIGMWLVITCFIVAVNPKPEDKESWEMSLVLGVGTLLLTAVCGTVIVWRLLLIRRVFAYGEVVQGRILHVGENVEGIGYAMIAYQYQGREHQVKNVTQGLVGRGGFAPDDPVDLVVDPRKPSRAFVVKLYAREV
jgi:hypothetical protein